MYMKLDGVELIKRTDDGDRIKELRNIHNLAMQGKRSIVEIRIPGASRNAFQDFGREPLTIIFEGSVIGVDADDTINEMEAKFEKGEPLPFETDIASIKSVTEVVIVKFVVRLFGGVANGINYSMALKEHKPDGKKGEGGAPSQKGAAKDEVKKKTELSKASTPAKKEETGKSENNEGSKGGKGKEEKTSGTDSTENGEEEDTSQEATGENEPNL